MVHFALIFPVHTAAAPN